MITESVVCLLLRCSRCNRAFREDANDEWEGVVHWDTRDQIIEQFNKGSGEYGGWRRFGDRFLCGNCQICNGYADDPDAREVPDPLPAAEADKVARAHAAYVHAERHLVDLGEGGWTILHPLSCRPNLFECPVSTAAQRDLTGPPEALGRFVCDVDSAGRFTVHERAVEVAS